MIKNEGKTPFVENKKGEKVVKNLFPAFFIYAKKLICTS